MSGNNTFAIANRYHKLGRCVIPSGGGRDGKSALIQWKRYQGERPTEAQLEEWQRTLNPGVWAMPTGPVSGLFVVDCDTKEAVTMMESAGLKPHVKTTKGAHYYVGWPSWTISNSSRLLPGVDIRGSGGYVNFCGGNGKVSYEVLIMPTDDSLYAADKLPAELQKALRPKPKTVAERILQEALDRVRPGNRNDTGLWLACQLRDNGLSQAESEAVMLRYAVQVGNSGLEPYTESEALSSLQQAFTRPAREPWHAPSTHFNLTDMGNAERLVYQFGDTLHYCYERKKWLVWNGKVWEWDTGAKIEALAKETVRGIYREAADELDEDRRKELASHARRSESDNKINAMIILAQSEKGIPIDSNLLDANKWLFNCINGTLNLRTGELRSHRKEDLLTVIVPLEYQPNEECPLWHKFLKQVTAEDIDLQSYLQRAVGYSLTGQTTEQCLFFLYGLGNNGKTTFLETILAMTGEYGDTLSTESLMAKGQYTGGPKESLANLRAKRLIIASEVQEGRRLNVGLVKDLTGSDTIKADRKYEHEISFKPTHKLWIRGNHKPVIAETSLAIWRRVRLIPFTVTIPVDQIDKGLPDKLRDELPGILAWAVKGCAEWQQEFTTPQAVAMATTEYRQEQDILNDFFEDYCILAPEASITKADLRAKYKKWCEDNNIDTASQTSFKARLIERGIREGRSGDGKTRLWRGIRLWKDTDNLTKQTEFSRNFPMEEISQKFHQNSVRNVSPDTNTDKTPAGEVPKKGKVKTYDSLIEFWKSRGAPLIHLRQGEKCDDLEKLLSNPNILPEHFETVKNWATKEGWTPPSEEAVIDVTNVTDKANSFNPLEVCIKAEGFCGLRTGKETFSCIYEPSECSFFQKV